jgi:hypothetical protein
MSLFGLVVNPTIPLSKALLAWTNEAVQISLLHSQPGLPLVVDYSLSAAYISRA